MRSKFGPTGEYPLGSLGPDDKGALQVGVAHDSKGNVIINFGTEVSWLGMTSSQAVQFALNILRHAGVKKVAIETGEDDANARQASGGAS
jgi:hypothetical protein